jgi:hypothetical protein
LLGVVFTFGVMFAPNQLRAASEMLRVCRNELLGMRISGAGAAHFMITTHAQIAIGRHVASVQGPDLIVSPCGFLRRVCC